MIKTKVIWDFLIPKVYAATQPFCLGGNGVLCFDTNSPISGINQLVNFATVIGTFVAIVTIASAGFQIAGRGDDPAQVKDGMSRIQNAIFGLALILVARGAVYVAFSAIGIV